MRRIVCLAAAAALALTLTACGSADGGGTALSTPAAVAQTTTADERAAITAEIGYTAASTLGADLARAGLIDRASFKAADAKGYRALQAVRAAYDAGNAPGLASGIVDLNAAVAAIRDLAH